MTTSIPDVPTIPGCTLEAVAGSGGWGTVYRGRCGTDARVVAVKVLRDADTARRFRLQTEFRLLSGLEHPALVRMHDFGYLENGYPFFIMDWVEGDILSPDSIRDASGHIDAGRFAALVYDLTAVLAYIHSRKIMHGDLKPANIMVTADGPRLMDFGLSFVHDTKHAGDIANEGLSGTLEYLAPELIHGEAPSPATDLYALGCVLFELAEGTPPYVNENAVELLRSHLHDPVPLPPEGLPPVCTAWITTLLQKQPQLRYRDALQLHNAAAAFLDRPPALQVDSAQGAMRLLSIPRTQEDARTQQAWEQSRAESRMLLVEGPTGIGKTRFLRDHATEIQFTGARVLHAEFRQGEASFAPFLRLFENETPGHPEADTLRARIATWFPDGLPGVEAASRDGLQADSLKLRTLHAAAELLCRYLDPDMLVVDNMHDADDFSREFLHYLLAWIEANNHAGLFILASRDPASDTAAGEVDPQAQSPRQETMRLPALTKDEISQALHDLLGDISPSFVDIVTRQSKGVPGRIEELLTFALLERILEATDHGWLLHEQDNLGSLFPASLTQYYAHAVRRLDDGTLFVLEALSLTPAPASIDALVSVTGLDAIVLRGMLGELLHFELIEGRFDALLLAHGAVREALDTVNAEIDPSTQNSAANDTSESRSEISSLHQAWYHWYQKSPPKYDAEAVLAHHAMHSGDSTRALPHLLEAARYREQRFDYAGARRVLRDALPLLDAADTDQRFAVLDSLSRLSNILGYREEEEDFLEEMLLLAAQSNSRARLGKVYKNQTEYYLSGAEFDRARRSAEKALSYFVDVPDSLGQAWCHQKIGFAEYRTRPGENVLTHYGKARSLFGGAEAVSEEGNILIDIGLVYYSILENPEKALACFGEARAMFEDAQDKRGLTRAYGNMGAQYYALGRYTEALEFHGKANELAVATGDRRLLATSCGALGQCEIALCRYSSALLHLEEELRISREIRDRYLQEMCLENLGELYMTLGTFDKAIESYTEAQTLAGDSGNVAGMAAGHIDIAGCLIEKRDFDGARKLLKKAATLLEEAQDVNISAMYHYRLGYLLLMQGNEDAFDQALDEFDRLGDIADRQGFDSFRILARSYSAIVQLRLGRAAVALDLSTEAVQLLDEIGPLYGGAHDILYHHALILRANRDTAGANDAITHAHEALMRNTESIADAQLYRSYLEQVRVNAEIVREFARTHRNESPLALTAVREQNLRTLYSVAGKINSVLDLNQLLDTIMDSALETMNGERGMIFLIEHDQLVLKVSRNVEKETIRDATEISLSILRDVLHAERPIIISDTSQNEDFSKRDSVINFNIHSLICVPMISRNGLIGTVYVDSRSDAVSAMSFSEIDAEFLIAFANLATMAIENARMHEELKKENLYLRREVEQRFGFENIIGVSKPMEKLFAETQAAIQSEGSVLIYGESGTGKELIAKAIHYNGPRHEHRFVAVDCGALPDSLLESELFGYKRGAFTGAVTDKPGLFEEAHNGTLFLDEISNTSLAFQAKLLRVLQEGEFRRVGDPKIRMANVRVICATNTNLREEIETGRFRQDLFYRLNVIPITVPPLRDRISDIPLLVEHFISKFNIRNPSPVRGVSSDLVEFLQKLSWNGNVRELENLVNRLIAQAQDEVLTTRLLPSDYLDAANHVTESDRGDFEVSLKAPRRLGSMRDMEKEHISFVLKHTEGNKTEAAKILGLKRTTLVERMKKLGMM
ncbi:MAG: sigma 54-interacting transcriptional regulator [Bacteroidetes bacterium]|nr:sigma 54-interacting transcriptional regulator [Bacteroidota bacterium]